MNDIVIGNYLIGDTEPAFTCPECKNKGELVDVLSIEERPWSLPVWYCRKCRYLYSGRSTVMQNTALNFATASKKYIVDTINGKMPSLKQAEEFNRRMKREEDPITELRKSIKGFKLK